MNKAKIKDKNGIMKIKIELDKETEKDMKKILEKKKDKINIEISKETQMSLDNLRREIVEFISRTNDLKLMKKVEKCSYDKLILLLNIGFSEKSFYDTLSGKVEMTIEDVVFAEKSREILNQLLEEKKEEKKEEEEKREKENKK